jgi:hypothetical protein
VVASQSLCFAFRSRGSLVSSPISFCQHFPICVPLIFGVGVDFEFCYLSVAPKIFNIYWLSEILKVSFFYRGADKSLARPGRKQATATEDFVFHVSYL